MKFDEQIQLECFKHVTEKGAIKSTIDNLKVLFNKYGIKCGYDVILKKQFVYIDGLETSDLSETAGFASIKSLLALNNMRANCVDLIPALMERNQFNPIINWITATKWDGVNRMNTFADSITVNDADVDYRDRALRTWLIQCVAAADSAKNSPLKNAIPKFELVLVLQGGQGVKKTSWFRSLVPDYLKEYVKTGSHLDPSNTDSVKACISTWICELGEIDATFRKADTERLKAFLSNTHDAIRLPYDRVQSNFARRTSFGGSVNPKSFLNDTTGARRYLPIAVTNCNPEHNVDLQQLWAQVYSYYLGGEQWWCDDVLEGLLKAQHDKHREDVPTHEMIKSVFDLTDKGRTQDTIHKTITELLKLAGIALPTSKQIKEARELLSAHEIAETQYRGTRGYWLNLSHYKRENLHDRDHETA